MLYDDTDDDEGEKQQTNPEIHIHHPLRSNKVLLPRHQEKIYNVHQRIRIDNVCVCV